MEGLHHAVGGSSSMSDGGNEYNDFLEDLEEDPELVAKRFRDKEIDHYDVVRRHGVICNWGTGDLLPNSTRDFRAAMKKRSAAHWACAIPRPAERHSNLHLNA